jgi:hypothetical protein
MFLPNRTPLVAVLLLVSLSSLLGAETAPDPSGHWDGSIQAPGREVTIEIDLAKNGKGELSGTFGNPSQNESGFPLANMTLEGRSIKFEIKGSSGVSTFQGEVSADGKTMSGDFVTSHGVSVGFSLTRTGEARIQAPVVSPAVGKALEGTWTGTVEVKGEPRKVGLTLSNHPDGTATGSVLSSDGMEIPITSIVQKGSSVTLEVRNVGGSYAGVLNGDGSELSGIWTQGKVTKPITFRRAAAP